MGLYILRGRRLKYLYYIKIMISVSEDCFDSRKRVDPDEISHPVAFHLGLHCLPKYLFRVSSIQRVNIGHILLVYHRYG